MVIKGVGSSAPFLMTRKRPPCSQTKMRPSGAIAIAVGLAIPEMIVSVKPAGSVAALATLPGGHTHSTSRAIKKTRRGRALAAVESVVTLNIKVPFVLVGGNLLTSKVRCLVRGLVV